MKDSVIILCGGGPAPGMNTVVCSVAKTFLSNGFRVIGLHGGYSGLFSKTPRTEDLDFFKADAYFNRGLVLIYLRDSEKGCIDLSRAGELGVDDAYSVISKYCENESN